MGERNLLKQVLEASREVWDRPETRSAVRKNFAKVLDCGTPALGWEVYASDNAEKRCYHRCKSRFCASCGYRATLLWLEYQEAALPDIPYTGIVFTMPRELWSIFKRNRHLLHDLPVLGADVIQQWINMKYGVTVLIIVVPHTFGGDLKFNTHLHILISAGGLLGSGGRWLPRIELHKNALMRMWRYAVITHLRGALKAQVLKSHLAVEDLKRILTIAYERHPQWIIFIDKIASKSHFLLYAARYVRRPPIANWRLLEVTDREVVFVAKDTKTKRLVPTPRPTLGLRAPFGDARTGPVPTLCSLLWPSVATCTRPDASCLVRPARPMHKASSATLKLAGFSAEVLRGGSAR
jgi:putative transposase/transposase-like zinc-binding protein